jgi:glycosyltransferase involved in cell wall biosynthesis
MFIVRFNGGLGNQIFQYNFANHLKEKFPYATIKLDIKSAYTHLATHGGFALKQNKFKQIKYCKHQNYYLVTDKTYNDDIKPKDNIIFLGYWQDLRYFPTKKIEFQEILGKIHLNETNKQYLENIKLHENSVAMHIRRGDYVEHYVHGNISTKAYFQNAITYINQKFPDAFFFVFSDDIPWVKQNVNFQNNSVVYIAGNNNTNYSAKADLYLMSQCKHNIISNSSFSWWAQQFNNNPEKTVIMPEYWVNDWCDAFGNIKVSLQTLPHMISIPNIPISDVQPDDPFFSIIVLAYNQENCIRRALVSVLNQSFQNFELIIVNDGSTDNTTSVIIEQASQNKKIFVLNHVKNESMLISRIDGVMKAKGRYILFLDGDDYFIENALEILYQKITENPGYDFYEFGYVRQPSQETVFDFNKQDDRFKALFYSCSPTIWNKAYDNQLLKKAFSSMKRTFLNYTEDTYESIVVACFAKKIMYIEAVIINYVMGIGMSTSITKNFYDGLKKIKSIRHTLNCIAEYINKNKIEIRKDEYFTNLELRFLDIIHEYIINTLQRKDDRCKLYYVLPKYFSFEICRMHFSMYCLEKEEEILKLKSNINKYKKKKRNFYIFLKFIFKKFVPRDIQLKMKSFIKNFCYNFF